MPWPKKLGNIRKERFPARNERRGILDFEVQPLRKHKEFKHSRPAKRSGFLFAFWGHNTLDALRKMNRNGAIRGAEPRNVILLNYGKWLPLTGSLKFVEGR